MISPGDWRWYNWLLFAAGILLVASYYGLLSWAPLEETIERLASHPGTRSAFQTASSRQEALFVIFAFLLLTPLASLVALFVLASGLAMVLGLLGPVTRTVGISDKVLALVVVAAAGVVAYARVETWWPWVRWTAGLVARAFIAVRS